jgi:WD40 repeat protein
MLRRIGDGAYGDVWLARSVTGAYHAVKVVYRERFKEERPYVREFEGIRHFDPISREHPGLVDILHVAREENGDFFHYVMELADNWNDGVLAVSPTDSSSPDPPAAPTSSVSEPEVVDPQTYAPKTLSCLLRHGPRLGAKLATDIASELAAALAYLHGHNIVHRDIKPSNVIFVRGQAKLADPGLAAAAGEGQSMVGTEGFIPPEGPGQPQADVYALGKLLYQMLTGLSPREDTSLKPEERYPSLPSDWVSSPDLAELNELRHIVLRACERDRSRRYKSADEIHSDLQLLRTGKSLAIRKLQHKVRTARRMMLATAVAALVVACGALVWSFKKIGDDALRRSELRRLQVAELLSKVSGWSPVAEEQLRRATRGQIDLEVKELAVEIMSGMDASLIFLTNIPATSIAFSCEGTVIYCGDGTNVLRKADGRIELYPAMGAGPVCWPTNGEPCQIVTHSNRVFLQNPINLPTTTELTHREAGPPVAAALSRDGRFAAAGFEGRVVIWNRTNSEPIRTLEASTAVLSFSPDSSLLAVGDSAGTVGIYTLPDLKLARTVQFPGGPAKVLCLAFGRDPLVRRDDTIRTNRWVLAAGYEGSELIIWDLATGFLRASPQGPHWRVSALAFSPDGFMLASSGRNAPFIADAITGATILKLSQVSSGLSPALAFNSKGDEVACSGFAGDGYVKTTLWNLEQDRGIQMLRGLRSPVRKVWISPDGRRVAALSDNWQMAMWGLAKSQGLFIFETPTAEYADDASGSFDASGRFFVFAGGKEVKLYDLENGSTKQTWKFESASASRVRFNATDRPVLLRRERRPGRDIPAVYELRSDGSKQLVVEQETGENIEDFALAPGGEYFLAWNVENEGAGRLLRAFSSTNRGPIWTNHVARPRTFNFDLCFNPSGESFAYTTSGKRRHIMQRHGSGLAELGSTVANAEAIDSANKQFAGLGWLYPEGTNETAGIPIAPSYSQYSGVPEFSSDGNLLVSGLENGIVLLMDIPKVRKQLLSLGKAK